MNTKCFTNLYLKIVLHHLSIIHNHVGSFKPASISASYYIALTSDRTRLTVTFLAVKGFP